VTPWQPQRPSALRPNPETRAESAHTPIDRNRRDALHYGGFASVAGNNKHLQSRHSGAPQGYFLRGKSRNPVPSSDIHQNNQINLETAVERDRRNTKFGEGLALTPALVCFI
jgi:hypothetical protein